MEIMVGVFFFIFGTLIGSFLNVVIFRYNTGKDLSGRSRCQSCLSTLGPLQLIPLLSFLIQKGRCDACRSKISIQYPMVELFTGVLFLLTYLTYTSIPEIVLSFIIVSLLMIIFVYDMKHGIIPNTFVYIFIALSFFALFIDPQTLSQTLSIARPSIAAFAAGPLFALPIWFLWHISGGRWIGLGDAKLFLGAGWFLGLSGGVTFFILSFWIGAVISLLLIFVGKLMRKKKLNMGFKGITIKTEIPFAPFIILSFFIVYFFEYNLVALITP